MLPKRPFSVSHLSIGPILQGRLVFSGFVLTGIRNSTIEGTQLKKIPSILPARSQRDQLPVDYTEGRQIPLTMIAELSFVRTHLNTICPVLIIPLI